MKIWSTLLLLVAFQHNVLSQTFEKITELPSVCHESSGLEILNTNLFVTHNDGGDGPTLYFIDSLGTIQREVLVYNAVNTDWEDISVAPDGRVFIGNFGNNNHSRKDLEILLLSDYKAWITDTITAKRIGFRYGDQTSFPPKADNQVFDCEAIAYYNDSLYIFSKNWSNPFNGQVKMYVLPAEEGEYIVEPRDSVNLGTIKEISWVTGADITDSSLYLVGSAFVWKFEFNGQPNLKKPVQLSLNHFSQKEAVSVQNDTIYITDESTGGFGNLYRYTPNNLNAMQVIPTRLNLHIVQGNSRVDIANPDNLQLNVEVFSYTGDKIGTPFSSSEPIIDLNRIVPSDILIPGIYMLHIVALDGNTQWAKVLISQ